MNSLVLEPNLKEVTGRLVAGSWSRYWTKVEIISERFCQAAYRFQGYQAGYLQKEDKQRLVALWYLIEKHGLSFEEGLNVLFDYWSEKGRTESRGRLPVRIWNFTGPVSDNLLREYVLETYPGYENKTILREEKKQRLLDKHPSLVSNQEYESVRELNQNYSQEIQTKRQRLEIHFQSQRAWRGNPWL